ncbi:kinase-like protein [Suillus weaverae]|nr:kinase-like protein [Suillus weaverae]
MKRFAPKHDIASDFTSQISALKLGRPCTSGAFGAVYRYTINTSQGTKEIAVKALNIAPGRAVEKYEKAMRRELEVWLKLSKHPTIVPLLGIAQVGFPLPVLVSQWMPSGTLYVYLKRATITASNKVELVKGVANGLEYLHSENVVHGDLHPGNVLIDDSGNPRLTDFGLATVAGNAELQLSVTSATCNLSPRWRAPEIIGVDPEEGPVRPNFKSDIYSFGGVMFFIVSGDVPWKEKNSTQIIIALSHKVVHTHPNNILDKHWNLIQKCWSWEPEHRPGATQALRSIDWFRTDESQGQQPKVHASQGLADLTGQIVGTIDKFVGAGDFGMVTNVNGDGRQVL